LKALRAKTVLKAGLAFRMTTPMKSPAPNRNPGVNLVLPSPSKVMQTTRRSSCLFFLFFVFFFFFFFLQVSPLSRGLGLVSGSSSSSSSISGLSGYTEQQWFELFDSLRRGRKFAKRATRHLAEGVLLEGLVSVLTSDTRSELLKCAMLVALQENLGLFLHGDTRNMERLCSLLSKLFDSSSAGLTLQCQALTTLTCVLAELSVVGRQPRLFESFVEVLLTCVSRVNSSSDAVLRSTACECLRELELLYPGLLAKGAGSFLVFAQTEGTFAFASYCTLFARVVCHATLQARASGFVSLRKLQRGNTSNSFTTPSGSSVFGAAALAVSPASSSSLPTAPASSGLQFLVPRPLLPFTVAASESFSDLQSSTSGTGVVVAFGALPDPASAASLAKVPDVVASEVRKNVSWLASEAGAVLSQWQLFDFLMSLLDLQLVAGSESVPPELFRQNFLRLMDLGSPLLLNAVLVLKQRLPFLFAQSDLLSDEHIMRKLLACGNDTSVSLEMRALAISLVRQLGEVTLERGALHALWRDLWPVVFDDWLVVSGKLLALVCCFGKGSAVSPPNLLSALQSLSEFRKHDCTHFLARITFAVLKLVLARLPEQFEAVYRFLLDLLVYTPKFLPNLIDLVSESSDVNERLLANFNQLLCSLDAAQLRDYLPLAERIFCVPSIDPTFLLSKVLAALQLPRSMTDGGWEAGEAMIRVYTSVLVHQSPKRPSIWDLVCKGLYLLSQWHADLEIRDRSHFLWYLATHVSPEKVALLLSGAKDESSKSPNEASTLLTAEGPKVPKAVVVKPFLLIERCVEQQQQQQPQQSGDGFLRWPRPELERPMNDEDAESSAFKDFLAQHPPAACAPVAVQMRLRYMSQLEMARFAEHAEGKLLKKGRKKPSGVALVATASDEYAECRAASSVSSAAAPPSCLVGATIRFADSARHQAQAPLEIPILREKDVFEFYLGVNISVPLPIVLKGIAEFSFVSQDEALKEDWGGCVVCARSCVDKMRWSIKDLFLEIPGTGNLSVLRGLWKYLWTTKQGDEMSLESVHRVERTRAHIEKCLLESFMAKFVIYWGSANVVDGVRETIVRLLVFLPPRHHLLFEVVIADSEARFFMRTDYWPVMAFMDSLLDEVFSGSK
jgi:hypothetical protein